MRPIRLFLLAWLLVLAAAQARAQEAKPIALFDGKTFAGWEGDTKNTWRIEEGALVAGSLDVKVPRNEFLCTTREFENFDLSFEYQIEGTEGFVNGGVQFRTKRIPNHHEVSGYQADLGAGHDGKLYDESRRKKTLAEPPAEQIARLVKKTGWNVYRIRAEGPHIELWLNGEKTVDYTEQDPKIDLRGVIAVQVHGNGKTIVRYRKLELRELAPTPLSRFGDYTPRPAAKGRWTDGKFALVAGDVVVFTGQTDMVRAAKDSTFETLLAARYADAAPRFRSMAWEGDTVYEQWRDLNFGTWAEQLAAVEATVVVCWFGQMEALDGLTKLGDFVAAYEKLLDQFATRTERIVVVGPHAFEQPDERHTPSHAHSNADVQRFAAAIGELARRRGYVFVDLSKPSKERLTSNGIHLAPTGRKLVSQQIATTLGAPTRADAAISPLRQEIIAKNRLWFDNWRPMNWTFAYGDRTQQPFGKPAGAKPALRIEFEDFKPLIARADARIHALARGEQPPAEPSAAPVATAVATEPPADVDHSPEAELKSFTIVPGFDVNLFASEADGVVKPLQMRWDDAGRLWVLCSPTYPHLEPGQQPGDYILVCEDTNADGHADRFTRFAEGLVMPMGIEFGRIGDDRGVYLTEATELVFLSDKDGDGRADDRRVILSGFGTGDSHQMINSLAWGPGGELWFAQGHHEYTRVETPWGIARLEKSGIWRYRPRTGRLDGFFNQSTAGLNCQGITYDDWGQIFHNSAAWSGGFYTVPGMIPTLRPLKYWPLVTPDRRNTGFEIIGTRHLPDELQGAVVWGGFMSNTMQLHRLVDDGSGFKAEVLPDLIKSNRREFRPVNTRVGPDGAIYVCDWYNSIIGHYQASYRDPARDKTHGRIWRVTAHGRPLAKQPNFASLTPTELLDQLRSPERLSREHAKRRLFGLPADKAIAATDAWLAKLDPADPEHDRLLVAALGVYEAHEAVPKKLLEQALVAKDPRARAYATRVVGHLSEPTALADSPSDKAEWALAKLEKQIRDEHPRVRLEAVVAASYVHSPRAIEVATTAVDLPRDRYLDYALRQCVQALKPEWGPALAAGKLHFGGHADRLRFLLEADGTKDVAKVARQLAETSQLTGADRERMLELLVQVGSPDDLRFALDQAGRSLGVLEALDDVARIHHRRPAGDLTGTVEGLLGDKDAALRTAGIRLAGVWNVRSAVPAIRAELSHARAPESLVLAAAGALVALEGRGALPLVEPLAARDRSPESQVAAIRAIATVDLPRAARLAAALLNDVRDESRMASLVLPLLAHKSAGDALARALDELSATGEKLSPDAAKLIQRVLAAAGRNDAALAAVLDRSSGVRYAKLVYDPKLVSKLAEDAMHSGDAARGQQVFRTTTANCKACHKLAGQGGDLGPDLSIVGAGRSPELIVESVLWPNRQVREGFMATRVITDEGLVYTGYKLQETADELQLRDTQTNQVRRIAKASIESSEDAGSIMPEGLAATMTSAELRDLIRFLCELNGSSRAREASPASR